MAVVCVQVPHRCDGVTGSQKTNKEQKGTEQKNDTKPVSILFAVNTQGLIVFWVVDGYQ